jgi:hypothetical protein
MVFGTVFCQVRAVSTEDVKEELTLLEQNLVLVTGVKARLARQQQGLCEEKGEKPSKPEDLVRLYDILIQVNIAKAPFENAQFHVQLFTFKQILIVESW